MKKLLLLAFLLFALPSTASACAIDDDGILCAQRPNNIVVPALGGTPLYAAETPFTREPIIDPLIANRVDAARVILKQCAPDTNTLVGQLVEIRHIAGNTSYGNWYKISLSDWALSRTDNELAWIIAHETAHAILDFWEWDAEDYMDAVIVRCAYLAPPGTVEQFNTSICRVPRNAHSTEELFHTCAPTP